jgi:hypothetical protein
MNTYTYLNRESLITRTLLILMSFEVIWLELFIIGLDTDTDMSDVLSIP